MSVTQETNSSTVFADALPNQEIQYVLTAARKELDTLLEQRSAILKRIATVRRTINGLVDTFGDAAPDKILPISGTQPMLDTRQKGLTRACRAVLMQSGEALTAIDVAEKILSSNAAVLRDHKNSVSSVTTILRRLHSYGEATTKLSRSGRRVWTWYMSESEP